MPTITLISTIHEEIGLCNASTLHEILERARPEVVFMEVPPFCFDQFFKEKTRSNLETDAVNRYLVEHYADVVPVDVMEASSELIAEDRRRSRELRARSREYSYLVSADYQYVEQHGFAYLNSKYYVELWSKVDAEINAALELIGNAELAHGYKTWTEVHEHREQEMMKNIQDYSDAHAFSTGVFLLGAGHRRSIMEIAANLSRSGSVTIDWNFGKYEGLIDGWRADAAAI